MTHLKDLVRLEDEVGQLIEQHRRARLGEQPHAETIDVVVVNAEIDHQPLCLASHTSGIIMSDSNDSADGSGFRDYLILSGILLISLGVLSVNLLLLQSSLLGILVALPYLSLVSLFCGNVFFPREGMRFRVFYGFVITFCFLVLSGTVSYIIRGIADWPMLAVIFFTTLALVLLNLKRRHLHSISGIKLPGNLAALNLGITDLIFVVTLAVSVYLLASVRTGESLPPFWEIVPGQFFLSFFLAAAALVIKVWQGKSPPGLLLCYTLLLLLIPAVGYLIVMRQPYADTGIPQRLEIDRMFSTFGRPVSHATHPDSTDSILGRTFIAQGQHIGHSFLIRLMQVPPLKFGLFFTPVFFVTMVVFATYDLMRSLAPRMKGLALIGTLSFLASQHTVFQFTPGGKPEAIGLGLLLVSMMLWVRFLISHHSRWLTFLALLVLLPGLVLVHAYVGLFALFLGVLAFTMFLMKPSSGRRARLLLWLGLNAALVAVWTLGFAHLDSLVAYVFGHSPSTSAIGGGLVSLELARIWETIAPPLWSGETSGVFQGVLFGVVNNSVYVTYALIILGTVAAIRYRLDKRWLSLSLGVMLLAFVYMSIVGNLFATGNYMSYRFFYYLNFLAYPLMGVGLYWFADVVIAQFAALHFRIRREERVLSMKPLQIAFSALMLAALFTSSFYAGYPRPDSMGPYSAAEGQLSWASDYDVAVMEFIQAREGDAAYKDYFIVCDPGACAAGMYTMGAQVVPFDNTYVSIYSTYGHEGMTDVQYSNMAHYQPYQYLVEGLAYTNTIAPRTYLVLSYRAGAERLKSLTELYSSYFGEPIYQTEGRIAVFYYDRQLVESLTDRNMEELPHLFDDELVEDGFWREETGESVSTGGLNIVFSDSFQTRQSGDSALRIKTDRGDYDYVARKHPWETPLDLSEVEYTSLLVYGTDSGRVFYLTFRSGNPSDYYTYGIDDNFESWRRLVIPLSSFSASGRPSWSSIAEMMLQFFAGDWTEGDEIYIDQISLHSELPLDLLSEGRAHVVE